MLTNNVIQTALSIARYSYFLDKLKELWDTSEIKEELNLPNELINASINQGYAWNKIFTQDLKRYTKKVDITNGINGISIINSSINKSKDGINDIILNYRINAKLVGNIKYGFRLANRCYFRSWIGKSISGDSVDDSFYEVYEKVYIT